MNQTRVFMYSQLKQARLQAGYTITQIAKHLYIKEQYLDAIEKNDFSMLPGKAYVEGYLKLYAQYLKVDLIRDTTAQQYVHSIPQTQTNQVFIHQQFSHILLIFSLIMLVLTVATYHILSISDAEIDAVSVVENIGSEHKLGYQNNATSPTQ